MSTYAIADIHGCLWVWDKVKAILQPEDKLYFIGDAVDRGPNGWQIAKEILDDPRIIYLMGNHEKMFLNCYQNYNGHDFDNETYYYDKNLYIWYSNGGQETENQFINDVISNDEKVRYIQRLRQLPFICVYRNKNNENIILCHAGCDFHDIDNLIEEDAIWDRSHYINNKWDGPDNTYIIHGHTPIPYILEAQEQFAKFYDIDNITPKIETWSGAYWYAGGHKCCIDCGVVFTGEAVLLNLDTWEETIITEENS